MWTPTTRRQHSREGLRYETDLTDAEWAVIEPLLPVPSKRGRPPKWTMREIFDAIFYVLRGGVAWSLLPNDLPPKSTVFGWFSVAGAMQVRVPAKINLCTSSWHGSGACWPRRFTHGSRASTARASRPRRAAVHAWLRCRQER